MRSKAGKLLTRYFPDVVSALLALKPQRFVLDGELVISVEGSLSFEHLLERMSPSPTRVKQLVREHPALFFAFDFLVDDKGQALVESPLSDRRRKLKRFSQKFLGDSGQIQITPVTYDRNVAQGWFELTGEFS